MSGGHRPWAAEPPGKVSQPPAPEPPEPAPPLPPELPPLVPPALPLPVPPLSLPPWSEPGVVLLPLASPPLPPWGPPGRAAGGMTEPEPLAPEDEDEPPVLGLPAAQIGPLQAQARPTAIRSFLIGVFIEGTSYCVQGRSDPYRLGEGPGGQSLNDLTQDSTNGRRLRRRPASPGNAW